MNQGLWWWYPKIRTSRFQTQHLSAPWTQSNSSNWRRQHLRSPNPGHSLQGHWHRCINTSTGLPLTSFTPSFPLTLGEVLRLRALIETARLPVDLGMCHSAVETTKWKVRWALWGLRFKWMTPWAFQWISNFWRLSSPSSILAAHLGLACQIWACSSEHVKEYVTTSVGSQHYWRMRYINMKILWGWDHLLLSQFSVDPAKLCARQLRKPQELYIKSGYWTSPHAASMLGVTYPLIKTASDHASYRRVMSRHPATASMSCFICVELPV